MSHYGPYALVHDLSLPERGCREYDRRENHCLCRTEDLPGFVNYGEAFSFFYHLPSSLRLFAISRREMLPSVNRDHRAIRYFPWWIRKTSKYRAEASHGLSFRRAVDASRGLFHYAIDTRYREERLRNACRSSPGTVTIDDRTYSIARRRPKMRLRHRA